MRLAYECVRDDGGFPDLAFYCQKKLKQLDPKYKTAEDFNKYTPEEEQAANKDVLKFLADMNQNDKKLRSQTDDSKNIFAESTNKENSS